jgi:hypothetical protein
MNFGDGRVAHALLPEHLHQTSADAEGAAIYADILSDQEDRLIFFHDLLQALP